MADSGPLEPRLLRGLFHLKVVGFGCAILYALSMSIFGSFALKATAEAKDPSSAAFECGQARIPLAEAPVLERQQKIYALLAGGLLIVGLWCITAGFKSPWSHRTDLPEWRRDFVNGPSNLPALGGFVLVIVLPLMLFLSYELLRDFHTVHVDGSDISLERLWPMSDVRLSSNEMSVLRVMKWSSKTTAQGPWKASWRLEVVTAGDVFCSREAPRERVLCAAGRLGNAAAKPIQWIHRVEGRGDSVTDEEEVRSEAAY